MIRNPKQVGPLGSRLTLHKQTATIPGPTCQEATTRDAERTEDSRHLEQGFWDLGLLFSVCLSLSLSFSLSLSLCLVLSFSLSLSRSLSLSVYVRKGLGFRVPGGGLGFY